MIDWIAILFLTIQLSIATNCSQKCGQSPDNACCADDQVCVGYRTCQISNSGIRAWILVLRYAIPIVFLMIIIIIVACLHCRRDSNPRMQSTSFNNVLPDGTSSLPLSPQTEAHIISMIRQQRRQQNI